MFYFNSDLDTGIDLDILVEENDMPMDFSKIKFIYEFIQFELKKLYTFYFYNIIREIFEKMYYIEFDFT